MLMKQAPLLALLLLSGTATAQNVSKVGTTAAAFLDIGVGPRALAQGGAFVAAVDDATSLYWNPAGLSRLQRGEAFATHAEWLGGLDFNVAAVALPIAGGTAGVQVTMLRVPDMLVRTEDFQQGTGETFNAADLAVGVSYGRQVTDRFRLGGTVKYIEQRIWNESASGLAVDLGTQFQTDFFGGLTIGAAVTNFGGDLRLGGRDLRRFFDPSPTETGNNGSVPVDASTEAWGLPLSFSLGVAVKPLRTRLQQLTVSVDALHPSSNYESLNAGFEYGFRERFFLRGGYEGLFLPDHEGGLSGGVAVHYPLPYAGGLAKLDYAYRHAGRLGGAHVVGLAVTF